MGITLGAAAHSGETVIAAVVVVEPQPAEKTARAANKAAAAKNARSLIRLVIEVILKQPGSKGKFCRTVMAGCHQG
ncbi:MAG: hypothetical protein M0Z32_04425 [Actinomycetota bacterium]|nr:hypothetical protein [Actinomycetota bacterium]MDA8166982.1 hypothetical protein [Actinomycetota bacterium]